MVPSAKPERLAPDNMMRLISRIWREEQGQDLIEYALLAACISIVCVSFISSIGLQVNSWYEGYDAKIKTIPGGSS